MVVAAFCLSGISLAFALLFSINLFLRLITCGGRVMELFASEFVLLVCSLVSFVTIVVFRWLFYQDKIDLPPGPRRLPVLGNLAELIGTPPHVSLMNLARKYGPLMYLRLGQQDCIVASSPEMAKEFLKNQDANFCGRPHVMHADIVYNNADIAFSQVNPNWRHLRRIFQFELTGLNRLEATKHVRQEELACMLHSIKQEVGPVDLHAQFSILMANIVCRMVFNKRYVDVSKGISAVDKAEAQEFRETIEEWELLLGTVSIGDFIPALAWLDILQGYPRRLRKVQKRLHEFATKIIAEHRAKRRNAPMLESDKDMVDVLLDEYEAKTSSNHITEGNMMGVILNAFIAGTDTTILTTEWAISEVFREPLILKKAVEELDAVVGHNRLVQESDLPHLKYIQSICKETFRLHPPVPLLLPHESIQATKASGYDIPAKSRMLVNVYAIGRDPNTWDDPLKFLPERFMEGSKYSQVNIHGQDFELLPFGSGRRSCPGMHMGNVIVQVTVANVLHAFNWSLPDQMNPKDLDMSEVKGITVSRAVPLLAIAKPRLSHNLYD